MWCKIEGYHLKWSIIGVWAETADPSNIIFRTNPYPDQVQEPVVPDKIVQFIPKHAGITTRSKK